MTEPPSAGPAGSPGHELIRRTFLKLAASLAAGSAAAPVLASADAAKAATAAAAPDAGPDTYLATMPGPGRFPLVAGGRPRRSWSAAAIIRAWSGW